MTPLSQQLREIVEKSPTSSYAIAREAEISKSAMSRFMNGGRLTMEKLDSLAKVLGVVVASEVSLIPAPLPKGRPSTKEKVKEKMNKSKADFWANHFAKQAHNDHFSSRRGVWEIEDLDCLLYYNNNPYKDVTIRQREVKRIKAALSEAGIKVIGFGQSGEKLSGSEEKYTIAMLIDCSVDRMPEVVEIAHDASGFATSLARDLVAPEMA